MVPKPRRRRKDAAAFGTGFLNDGGGGNAAGANRPGGPLPPGSRPRPAAGTSSSAFGDNSVAQGISSVAAGHGARATGDNSAAVGPDSTASGDGSSAYGNNSTASGNLSSAYESSGSTRTVKIRQFQKARPLETSTVPASNNGSSAYGAETQATQEDAAAFGTGFLNDGGGGNAAGATGELIHRSRLPGPGQRRQQRLRMATVGVASGANSWPTNS